MWIEVCQELLYAFEAEGQDSLSNVVTGDEMWAYLYDLTQKIRFNPMNGATAFHHVTRN